MKYLLLLIFPLGIAVAGDRHYYPEPPPTPIIEEYSSYVTQVIQQTETKGVALGIATGQHHHDFGTHKWQWSAGYGHFDSNDAFSLSIGKRVDRVLINGSIGREGSDTGYGVGFNGRF